MKTISKFVIIGWLLLFAHAASAVDCNGLPTWQSSSVYVGGDEVEHNNHAYRANWWTQNQDPAKNSDSWGVWKDLGKCGGGDPGENERPVANANGPYSANVNNSIAFSSLGSNDPDGHIASYQWDFGDGNSSTQSDPSHSYSAPGSYTVTLTVTDNKGATDTDSTTAEINSDIPGDCDVAQYQAGTSYNTGDVVSNVGRKYRCNVAGWCSSTAAWAYEPGVGSHWEQAWTDVGDCVGGNNRPPVADANGPYSGQANVAVQFSSAGSNDPDGTIISYHWQLGDGVSSSDANPSHTYIRGGNYTATLTVTDNEGATNSQSVAVSITDGNQNTPPTASTNGPYSGVKNSPIAFSSAGSIDPDGSIISYSWSFGDGTSSNSAKPSHSYANAGTYNVSLTVTDNEGASHTDSTSATVDAGGTPSGKKVIGYFTEWGTYDRNYHVKNIVTSGSINELTHIMYAFGNVTNGKCVMGDNYAAIEHTYDATGSVDGVADDPNAEIRGNFAQIRRLKAMYPHIKVVWSFGGWTWSDGFGQAAQNPEAFAQSCYDLVFDPKWSDVFDGIDIDWEYPNACGLQCDSSGYDSFRRLMQALRNTFGNKLVTAAISAGKSKLDAADYSGASAFVDFYMVMTYDFFGAWSAQGPTAPHSPLHSYNGIPEQDFYSDRAIQVLKSKGVPGSKLLLGIGFYGRGWTGVTQSAPGGSATGGASGGGDYRVLKNTCPANGLVGGTAYAHCGNNWWSYDTPQTINGKMQYLKQQGLSGAFFWELGGDTDDGELIKAIGNGLN